MGTVWEHIVIAGVTFHEMCRFSRCADFCADFVQICWKCADFVQILRGDVQSHRKVCAQLRPCMQSGKLIYPVPIHNVPHFVCSPACAALACVQGSGAIWELKICTNLHKSAQICTESAHFENLHISRKVGFPTPACSQMVRLEKKVNYQITISILKNIIICSNRRQLQ